MQLSIVAVQQIVTMGADNIIRHYHWLGEVYLVGGVVTRLWLTIV